MLDNTIYTPKQDNIVNIKWEVEPTLIILSGGSGTGKSTIAKLLIEDTQYNIKKLITSTTRPQREGEVDGKDYYFVNKSQFDTSVLKEEFLEHVEYNQHFYGTHKGALDFVLKKEKANALLILDTKGMFKLKDYCRTFGYNCLTIWLETSQITHMIAHMRTRETPADEILNRLIIWEQETQHRFQYDMVCQVSDLQEAAKAIKNKLLEKYGK